MDKEYYVVDVPYDIARTLFDGKAYLQHYIIEREGSTYRLTYYTLPDVTWPSQTFWSTEELMGSLQTVVNNPEYLVPLSSLAPFALVVHDCSGSGYEGVMPISSLLVTDGNKLIETVEKYRPLLEAKLGDELVMVAVSLQSPTITPQEFAEKTFKGYD